MLLQSKLPQVGLTIFTQMSQLANAHNALNLSQGFPDFDASEALKEALQRQCAGRAKSICGDDRCACFTRTGCQ